MRAWHSLNITIKAQTQKSTLYIGHMCFVLFLFKFVILYTRVPAFTFVFLDIIGERGTARRVNPGNATPIVVQI